MNKDIRIEIEGGEVTTNVHTDSMLREWDERQYKKDKHWCMWFMVFLVCCILFSVFLLTCDLLGI